MAVKASITRRPVPTYFALTFGVTSLTGHNPTLKLKYPPEYIGKAAHGLAGAADVTSGIPSAPSKKSKSRPSLACRTCLASRA